MDTSGDTTKWDTCKDEGDPETWKFTRDPTLTAQQGMPLKLTSLKLDEFSR